MMKSRALGRLRRRSNFFFRPREAGEDEYQIQSFHLNQSSGNSAVTRIKASAYS
jgi:hypothetical protein